MLIRLLTDSEQVAAVRAIYLKGALRDEQILFTVEALHKDLLRVIVDLGFHNLMAVVADYLVEGVLVEQPALAVPAQALLDGAVP
jgi:hypothetical protein